MGMDLTMQWHIWKQGWMWEERKEEFPLPLFLVVSTVTWWCLLSISQLYPPGMAPTTQQGNKKKELKPSGAFHIRVIAAKAAFEQLSGNTFFNHSYCHNSIPVHPRYLLEDIRSKQIWLLDWFLGVENLHFCSEVALISLFCFSPGWWDQVLKVVSSPS